MKTLYLDCGMGAAGDMLTAALLELVPDKESGLRKLNSIGIPHVTYSIEASKKCEITGTHVTVKVDDICEGEDHDHHHMHLPDVMDIISGLNVSDTVKQNASGVYDLIAAAESTVHGEPVDHIHFHEVGSLDAIADVTAVCMLIEELGIEHITASPINVGSGTVTCAHGTLPVPAPATAELLKGCPSYGSAINGELCTPTGAALIRRFADDWGPMPVMTVEKIGYGMGKKDFPIANCVRAFLGEADDPTDRMTELVCNVDDMTGEEIGFATEQLLKGPAVEVYVAPVFMKKNRPGYELHVLCAGKDKESVVASVFRYTTTIGIREQSVCRYTMERRTVERKTPLGIVREKISEGYGVTRSKFEYDDISEIAIKEEK